MERETEVQSDDGASLQHETAATAFSHTQADQPLRAVRGAFPLRAGITPRILEDYHARDNTRSPTDARESLHTVWVTLAQNAIADMPGWRTYTGQNREQTRGDGWLDAVHPDDRQRIAQLWVHAMHACALFQTTYRVRRRDGAYIAFDVRCVPVVLTDGAIQEWVWSYTRHLPDQLATATGGAPPNSERLVTPALSVPPSTQPDTSTADKNVNPMTPSSLTRFIPVFEAMAGGVIVYDTAGHLLFLNAAARALVEMTPADDLAQAATRFTIGDAAGHPFAAGHSPVDRILRGEALASTNAEQATIMFATGRALHARITGAPLYDAAGQLVGAAVMLQGISPDSQENGDVENGDAGSALAALLALAEAVIFVSDEASDSHAIRGAIEVPRATGQRLAALACDVIGCRRVSIVAIATENEILHPIAVAGLDAADEDAWRERLRHHTPRFDAALEPSVIERLRADQVVLIDLRQPPYDQQPNPYDASTLLLVPMLVGEQLIGILSLDYGGVEHDYALEEIALAGAVAKLAGLVIERERLLRDHAEAQASVLALSEAKRQMDEFLSIASHELRTPLTVIKANVQLLTRRIGQAVRAERDTAALLASLRITPDFLDRTQRQITRLDRLVSDLLDISRIEAGRLTLNTERFDLRAVVRDAVEEQRGVWLDRTITLDLPDMPVLVDADAERIGQVVTNYLTNALKYSRGDQHVAVVAVTGAPIGDTLFARVAVRDHGPGLTQAQRAHLWERFHRVSGIEVQSGSGVGLGLGLHISKTIIERHGGVTDVESTPGQGSTFWFTLPLAGPDN